MITIHGVVPSLKNNKQMFRNSKTGRYFPSSSQRVKDWNTDALWQLKNVKPVENYPVAMYATFYMATNRRKDMDNMLSTVQDILVKAGILEDDRWQLIPRITITAEMDKNDPRVEILFDEITV